MDEVPNCKVCEGAAVSYEEMVDSAEDDYTGKVCQSCFDRHTAELVEVSHMELIPALRALLGHMDGDIFYDASEYSDYGNMLGLTVLHAASARLSTLMEKRPEDLARAILGQRRVEPVYIGDEDCPIVDMVAAGYEATCPKCETLCTLIEVPRMGRGIECPECSEVFKTDLPEHAYG